MLVVCLLQVTVVASHVCQHYSPGKIKDLLAQGVLNSLTRLVLVNAIYFKGLWNKQFKEEQTRDAEFQLNKVKLQLHEHADTR